MFLHPRIRPKMNFDSDYVVEVPNVIDYETATRLKKYTLDKKNSGLHERGSKNPNVDAHFLTCMINNVTDPVYDLLDNVWQNYGTKINSNLEFIEKYEIKYYNIGDRFGLHNDGYRFINEPYDRKVNLTVQLSYPDEYQGGDLIVGDYKCTKNFGSAIFYPAHYYHRVTEITEGHRFCLIGHAWGPYNE